MSDHGETRRRRPGAGVPQGAGDAVKPRMRGVGAVLPWMRAAVVRGPGAVGVARAALILGGAVAAGWGGWLLWPQLAAGPSNALSVGGWLLGGPVLHDALLAPAVGALGLLVAFAVPPRWRTPVASGLVISGVLVLLALPGVLRPSAGPPNPGLADRNYALGLAAALAVVWLIVLVAGLALGGRRPPVESRPPLGRRLPFGGRLPVGRRPSSDGRTSSGRRPRLRRLPPDA